uniref:EGF-like domain-containing protein n=1 Tax=Biomphalaria glabrata TaxID=6526 RepID=A0A2C9LU56_BIOGL
MIFWLLLIIVTETRVARSREPPCLTKDICPCNTYCSEQADYSVKCYPCHSECEPSQGCDGPMSEQCRACKTGYTKQPGFSPCRASTCPVGTYGNQCKNQCHCHKNYLCVQGRCTGGQCERGRTGLPFCLEGTPSCPFGTYGNECQNQCHCLNNDLCEQGLCNGGKCERGRTGLPFCLE